MPSVTIRTVVHPTEDPERVRKAICNLFPNVEFNIEGDELVAQSEELTNFKNLIRKQKILDVTRSMMWRNRRAGGTLLHINKQVAYVGKISYIEEDAPLGTMRAFLHAEDVESLMDEIAPRTVDGEEI